ncbi:hypothetical protein QE152_g35119 [Popillia japonica]|uniref:Uncharacterized protein n=1 Tax=Popillia japonica TaxID=7064 RepID=A0AAW1IRS3_POPJA
MISKSVFCIFMFIHILCLNQKLLVTSQYVTGYSYEVPSKQLPSPQDSADGATTTSQPDVNDLRNKNGDLEIITTTEKAIETQTNITEDYGYVYKTPKIQLKI